MNRNNCKSKRNDSGSPLLWSSLKTATKQLSFTWKRFLLKNSSTSSFAESIQSSAEISPRLRYIFIIVAFLFLTIAGFFLLLVLVNSSGSEDPTQLSQEALPEYSRPLWKLKTVLNNHRSVVIFLSATFALFQLLAIGAAIFNWSIILFSYVIITGIFGTIVGIVGIVGIIFTCLLMRHDSKHDHTITITVAIVISFVFIFYLMTVLGIRLMEYFRRRMGNQKKRKSIRNLRLRYDNRNKHRCTSIYSSINSILLPINHQQKTMEQDDDNNGYDDDDEQQMTRISLLSNSSNISNIC